MAVIDRNWLEKYLDLELNVLFRGLHGVGKTEVIKDVMNARYGNNWRYFSASTLDPWVDLIGTPRPVTKDGKEFLDLIRPEFIVNGKVEAIYFDEFNRAPDKILNAAMELIQFKSINGFKLPHLKVVWAAINPEDDDDTYSVNHLDPAHIDRFHVHYDVPYKIDEDYFRKKYPDVASFFIQWWKNLPGDTQKKVSPRRLDYAANAFINGCRLEHFLPAESNIKLLRDSVGSSPFVDTLKSINNIVDAEKFLRDQNNATKLLTLVKQKNKEAISFFSNFGKTLPQELVEPYIDVVQAHKYGAGNIRSIEDLINALPDSKGDQNQAAMINAVDLAAIFDKTKGSLKNDLLAIKNVDRQLINKLANRCSDIILRCRSNTLMRIMWGISGVESPENATNFNKICITLSSMGLFNTSQLRRFNDKLYGYKIVKGMHYF